MSTYLAPGISAIVLYGIYQLFWYYPKKMRSLIGLDRKPSKVASFIQSGSGKEKREVSEEHTETMFNSSQKIAHRGIRLEGLPENSIAAFYYALHTGKADVIECDVWLTKDHQIVVHHDESLLRMTGVDKLIHEVNYADLPPLLTNLQHQSEKIEDYLTTINNNQDHIQKIPTLKEVLELLPSNKFIDIEFKQLSSDLIQKVNDLIYELGKERQVYWFSLDEKINKHLRLYDHQLPSIVSIQNIMIILFYYYIGVLPFIQLPDKVFGITLEEVRMFSKLYFVLFFFSSQFLVFFSFRHDRLR